MVALAVTEARVVTPVMAESQERATAPRVMVAGAVKVATADAVVTAVAAAAEPHLACTSPRGRSRCAKTTSFKVNRSQVRVAHRRATQAKKATALPSLPRAFLPVSLREP
jgi:hypothetical protein